MINSDDVTNEFALRSSTRGQESDVREMEEWLRNFQPSPEGAQAVAIPVSEPSKPESAPLPTKPAVRKTSDPLGRPEPAKKSEDDSLTEQVVGGVDDAARNALGWLDPMTNWLNDNVADLRYDRMPAPKSMSGTLVRKTSEFLTGFIPAIKALKAVGVTGAATQGMLGGAIADFAVRDPHEGRLADLWQEAGLPHNILTDYLASEEDDTEPEARFKNAAEGVFLGATLEGVMLGARALRAARGQPGVKEAEEEILRARYGEVPESEYKRIIGDPTKPAIEISVRKPHPVGGKIKEAIEGGPDLAPRALIRGKKGTPLPEDFEVFINFARIDEPDQVKFVMGKMAEAMKANIDEAKRGVITHQETEKLAEDLGMSVPQLLSRWKGQAFNAEQIHAARTLWAASAEELLKAAKIAAGKNAGALDHFRFRRQMAVHSTIQEEVLAVRAEAGRALDAWKISAKGGIERARAIEQVMKAMGGPQASSEMAKRLAILAEVGDVTPAALARFVSRGAGAKTADTIREVWVNGLLSSPKTHAVNIMSNTLVSFQQIYERGAAAQIRQFTGGEGVVSGEATAMAYGMVESFKDAFRMGAKALKTGESGWAFNKLDIRETGRPKAVSSEAYNLQKETGMGRAVDFIGTVTNVPGRLLVAEDEFFKTIGYRMELHAQALRQGTSEGLKGRELALRMREIVDDPPEHIQINAADSALYNTFTSEMGAFGRNVMNLRNIDHPANPLVFILPFVRTPVNIARYAFERSPFAPLVSQWRDDIAAGGGRADLALARMSTGTAIMAVAMDFADSGLVTGEGPRGEDKEIREALQREGWKPYSVKIGDRWYSYNRTDPFGMTIGFAASIAEAIRKGQVDQDDVDEWQEVSAMAIAAVAQVSISKTYLEGFAKFVEVLSDPKRYSERYINDLLASFIPATSLNSAVKNMVDPVQRETFSPMDAVHARIASLSDKLTPRRTVWGHEITSASGLGKLYDFVSPIASTEQVVSPVDKEIVRMGAGPNRIAKKDVFDGVQVNMRFFPKVYDEYQRLAGHALKHPAYGMGAKDFLDAVVSGNHALSPAYKILPDEGRKKFIAGIVSEYRSLAQREILQKPEFRNFAQHVEQLKEIHRNSRMPVLEE